MTTAIKSVSQANTQFRANLKSAAVHVEKSHGPLVWALMNAIETQDLSQLDKMRAMVVVYWPTLVSRFDDYVLATLDNVKLVGVSYDDDGELFKLSKCASLSTAWNVRKRLAKSPMAGKPVDIREDITRTINKLAKCTRGELPVVEAMTGATGKLIADILAQAKADIEAACAGTYKVAAQPANNADVANVTPIKKTKAA